MRARRTLALLSLFSVFGSSAVFPATTTIPVDTDYIKGEDRYYGRPSPSVGRPVKKSSVAHKKTSRKKIKLAGRSSLFTALSLATDTWGFSFRLGKDVKNKEISIVIETSDPAEFIDSVCMSADVWCDYIPSQGLVYVRAKKTFVVDVDPEGLVMSSYGGAQSGLGAGAGAGGGGEESGGEGGTSAGASAGAGSMGAGATGATGRALSYFIKNLSYTEFVSLLTETFGIDVVPSPLGYLQMSLSPSEYQKITRYFEESKKRTEIVNVEIKLLRVDLKDEFKWGVNWSAILSGFRVGKVTKAIFGVNSTALETTDPRGTIGLVTKGSTEPSAVLEALETYGDVHTVDSWYYQMKTGTPIPFANYRLERYITLGASQSQSTTEITADVNEDEVGFRGSLAVYKRGDNSYYVDGFVDISLIRDYTEVTLPGGGVQKAPNIEGKGFRISTALTSLDRTIVVGGFRTLGITSEDKGVPLLQKIPILGYLFKGKKDLKQNSEFVVLITIKPSEEKHATDLLPEEEELLKNF